MLNRKFTPAEIADIKFHCDEVIPEVRFEIIDESMVWLRHFEEGYEVSGQLFIMENGLVIAHTVSGAEIFTTQDICDGLSYLADIVLTS
jgi:hypothetical protein